VFNHNDNMRSEVLTATKMSMAVLWVLRPFELVDW
jgi:hypothetical protein